MPIEYAPAGSTAPQPSEFADKRFAPTPRLTKDGAPDRRFAAKPQPNTPADQAPPLSGARPVAEVARMGVERPSARVVEEQKSRRRRQDTGPLAGLKMHIPEHLKSPGFEYRFVNDDGRRIHAKTVMDDWDVVRLPPVEGKTEGEPYRVLVGKSEGGHPLYAYLCRKPEEYYRADKAKEQRAIKEQEAAIKRSPTAIAGGLSGSTAYVPDRVDGFSSGNPGENVIRSGE